MHLGLPSLALSLSAPARARCRALALAFLASFALAPSVHAAATGENALSWEDVRKLALERNPNLESKAASFESSRAFLKSTYGAFLPQLTLTGAQHRTATESAGIDAIDRRNLFGGTASLNLFNGFSSVASMQSARAAMHEAEQDRNLTSNDLRYQLRKAYFEVAIQQRRIQLFESIFKRLSQNQKLIQLKYDSGTEARWNVQKTTADADEAAYNLRSAKVSLEAARDQLAHLLQMDILPAGAVADVQSADIRLEPIDEDSLTRGHPVVLKNLATTDRLDRERVKAESPFYPSLDFAFTRDDERPLINPRINQDQNAFALTLTWNIFNGLSDYYRLQQASLAHQAADYTTQGETRRVLNDIRTTLANLRNGLDHLPSAEEQRKAGEERVKTVSAQYRAGLKTYLDWEDAQSLLTEAQQNEVNYLHDALIAFAEFERATGKLLEQP